VAARPALALTEPWVAMDLEMMIIEIVTATVVVEGSVAATKEVLHEALDFPKKRPARRPASLLLAE
jgi:hypothetical protein